MSETLDRAKEMGGDNRSLSFGIPFKKADALFSLGLKRREGSLGVQTGSHRIITVWEFLEAIEGALFQVSGTEEGSSGVLNLT